MNVVTGNEQGHRQTEASDAGVLTRHGRLNALASINATRKYLEIGVAEGKTFKSIKADYRVAVDPKFGFETAGIADAKTIFHEVTSDAFFTRYAPEHGKFDLIYLDGLHTFEQTFRDFCSSTIFAHEKTIWLIDDTRPSSWLSAHPSLTTASRIRRAIGSADKAWYGDVFKVVFAIADFFPQYRWATFPGHGQTVVWYEPRKDFFPIYNSLAAISRLTYREFKKHSHVMNVREPDDIIASVSEALAGGQDNVVHATWPRQ